MIMQQLSSPSLTPTSQHAGTAAGNAEADSPGSGARHPEVPLGTPTERVSEGVPAGEAGWMAAGSAGA